MRLHRRIKAILGRSAAFLAIGLAFLQPSAGQQILPLYYYDLGKEIKIAGLIQEIRFEPRPEGDPFLIILIQENSASPTYGVEIGPSGFFDLDLKKGERVKVVGSQCNMEMNCCNVIAREIRYRDKTVTVRDAYGFPVWRKGRPPASPRTG
jgi:hypothetical protein